MLKRGLLGLALVCFLVTSAIAQQMQDVVYLKNGSIIRGMIVEQIPNISVKIQTKDGSVFVCKVEDIEKITKEYERGTTPPIPPKDNDQKKEPASEKESFHPIAEGKLSELANDAKGMKKWRWVSYILGGTSIGMGIYGLRQDDNDIESRDTVHSRSPLCCLLQA